MRNLLSSFDEFEGKEIISDRDFQDYSGKYLDIKDEWKNKIGKKELEDITDDVVFELELLKQIEINIDYILMLVQKYHDSHCEDKEVLISIHKAIDSSLELRSKKQLIDTFISGINDVDDVMIEWRTFVAEEKERQLTQIISEEKNLTFNNLNRAILVNTKKVSGPYIVKAIGDKKYFESALTIKGGYIDEVKASGRDIEYKVEDNIVIPAYDGELTFKYAKENVKEKEVKE